MHELSIATSIIESATPHVPKDRKVSSLHLDVGVLSGVVKDALEFAFPEAAKQTPFEDCKLKINKIPLLFHCKKCGKRSSTEDIAILCQHCYDTKVEILEGKDILIRKMEIE